VLSPPMPSRGDGIGCIFAENIPHIYLNSQIDFLRVLVRCTRLKQE